MLPYKFTEQPVVSKERTAIQKMGFRDTKDFLACIGCIALGTFGAWMMVESFFDSLGFAETLRAMIGL